MIHLLAETFFLAGHKTFQSTFNERLLRLIKESYGRNNTTPQLFEWILQIWNSSDLPLKDYPVPTNYRDNVYRYQYCENTYSCPEDSFIKQAVVRFDVFWASKYSMKTSEFSEAHFISYPYKTTCSPKLDNVKFSIRIVIEKEAKSRRNPTVDAVLKSMMSHEFAHAYMYYDTHKYDNEHPVNSERMKHKNMIDNKLQQYKYKIQDYNNRMQNVPQNSDDYKVLKICRNWAQELQRIMYYLDYDEQNAFMSQLYTDIENHPEIRGDNYQQHLNKLRTYRTIQKIEEQYYNFIQLEHNDDRQLQFMSNVMNNVNGTNNSRYKNVNIIIRRFVDSLHRMKTKFYKYLLNILVELNRITPNTTAQLSQQDIFPEPSQSVTTTSGDTKNIRQSN